MSAGQYGALPSELLRNGKSQQAGRSRNAISSFITEIKESAVDRFVHHLFLSLVITLAGAVGVWAQEDSAPAEPAPTKDEPAKADPSKPLVSMMMTNTDEFFADLSAMMGKEKESKDALEKIHIVLDPFIDGLDPGNPAMNKNKPFGAVIYLEDSKLKTVFFFPVENMDEFLIGIDGVGILSKKDSGGFYKFLGTSMKVTPGKRRATSTSAPPRKSCSAVWRLRRNCSNRFGKEV